MEEKNLVDKIKDICEEFGEEFSKGHYLVVNYVKFKYFHKVENKNERIRIVEGRKKVFDYIKFRGEDKFDITREIYWKKVVDEYYHLMNRNF